MNRYSVVDYAAHLGVTPAYVRKLLREGRLVGERLGRSWMILEPRVVPPPTTRTYTFFTHAGGAGKTSLARDLGYDLARRGYRVLLVDADPQANLTSWLGVQTVAPEESLVALLEGERLPTPRVWPLEGSGLLHLISATLELALLEVRLAQTPLGELRLRKALAHLSGQYDYVLVDSPPSLGKLAVLAALAGQGFVVPVETSPKGLEALVGLHEAVRVYAQALDTTALSLIRLLVPTRYDPRNRVDGEVLERLRAAEGLPVAPPITYRPGLHKRATRAGVPIQAVDPGGPADLEVRVLTDLLLKEAR